MIANWDAAKFWLDSIQWVFTLGTAVFVWLRTGQAQSQQAIQAVDNQLEQLEYRMITMEENLKHAPTHEDISSVRAEIAGIKANLQQNTYMLQRVHDHLMQKH